MSAITDQSPTAVERRHRTSIAAGRERGHYRVLFDSGPVTVAEFARLAGMPEERAGAWLSEQLDAEVLRVVPSPESGGDAGDEPELLLPGEYVPILLHDRGESEFSGARPCSPNAATTSPRSSRPSSPSSTSWTSWTSSSPVDGSPTSRRFLDFGTMQAEDQVIRYAQLDGHPLGWAPVGQGPPLVIGGWWSSHLELDWRDARFRRFVGRSPPTAP